MISVCEILIYRYRYVTLQNWTYGEDADTWHKSDKLQLQLPASAPLADVYHYIETMSSLVNDDAKARDREKGARACLPQPLLLPGRVLYLLRGC